MSEIFNVCFFLEEWGMADEEVVFDDIYELGDIIGR